MSRDNRVQVYLSDQELAQVKEWADETGKSVSQLCRDAILEYTDHDRAARIEEEVRQMQTKLDDVLATLDDETSHTHKPQGGMQTATRAVEKARSIIRRLQAHHDDVIKADDVRLAIEDIAGADDRTIRKYKRLFRKRGLLFEHPGDRPMWTTEASIWMDWMADYCRMNTREMAEDVVDQYPAYVTETVDGKLGVQLRETTE